MPIQFEVDGHLAVITIEGRGDYNVFSPEFVYRPLEEAMNKYRDDSELWCAVIKAADGKKAFTYGGDIQALDAIKQGSPSARGYNERGTWNWLVSGEKVFPKPVVFSVIGSCIGAGTLLLMSLADIVVASEDARFGWPEIRPAIGPAASYGPGMLPRQLPWRISMELLLTGRLLNAQEAYQWGFINKVMPKDDVLPAAMAFAKTISGNPPLHVQAAKDLAYNLRDIPYSLGMLQGRLYAELLKKTPDAKEGPRAFMEKRKPRYTGKWS